LANQQKYLLLFLICEETLHNQPSLESPPQLHFHHQQPRRHVSLEVYLVENEQKVNPDNSYSLA